MNTGNFTVLVYNSNFKTFLIYLIMDIDIY